MTKSTKSRLDELVESSIPATALAITWEEIAKELGGRKKAETVRTTEQEIAEELGGRKKETAALEKEKEEE